MQLSDKDEKPEESYKFSNSHEFYRLLRELYGIQYLTSQDIERLIPIKEKYQRGEYATKNKKKG